MSNITLSAGIRANLLSLQNTANQMQITQNNLATGKKVNSALDNPLNFFTSQSLNTRASSLNGLLDAMSNGIQTIQAANNGITSITALVQQLKSVASQARADTTQVAVTPGATSQLGNNNTSTSPVVRSRSNSPAAIRWVSALFRRPSRVGRSVVLALTAPTLPPVRSPFKATTSTAGNAISVSLTSGETAANVASAINSAIMGADSANGGHVWAQVAGGQVNLVNDQGNAITVTDSTGGAGDTAAVFGAGATSGSVAGASTTGTVLGAASIAAAINGDGTLSGVVKASVDATTGGLDVQNLTSSAITLKGGTGGAITGLLADALGTVAAGTGGGISSARTSLMNQFNDLRTQIDSLAKNSGFNGVNLVNGDKLTLTFNENNTSSISVQMTDASNNPFAVNSTNLGLSASYHGRVLQQLEPRCPGPRLSRPR